MDKLTHLLAEIVEYQRLRASNALDDEGEWNFWMECHLVFAAYWAWEQAFSATDRDLAFLMSDEQRARWYCEDPPVDEPLSPIAAPAPLPQAGRARQRVRPSSPLQVGTRPRAIAIPPPAPPTMPVSNPPATIVPHHAVRYCQFKLDSPGCRGTRAC